MTRMDAAKAAKVVRFRKGMGLDGNERGMLTDSGH